MVNIYKLKIYIQWVNIYYKNNVLILDTVYVNIKNIS